MDDLDRLYFEFVETLRRERPSALLEPLTVYDLHEQLVPYRRVRNSVGFRSNDEYEATLSRLLAGERGYLLCDGDMQDELCAGLEEPLPDIRRYRAFADTRVWLEPEAIPLPGDTRFAPPEVRERVEWTVPPLESPRQTEQAAGLEPRPDGLADSVTDSDVILGSEQDLTDRAAPKQEDPSELVVGQEPALGEETFDTCGECGSDMPEGAAYCPFCGSRLSPEACPGCGAILEPSWLYCASCGAPWTRKEGESA